MRLLATGIGLITSIGYDVRTSCASARAGIARIGEIYHVKVTDDDTHEEAPISGCPVSPLTDGFGSIGRWTILGLRAIDDLIQYSGLDRNQTEYWERTAVVFALPDLEAPNFDFEGVVDSKSIKSRFVDSFIARTELAILPKYTLVVAEDDIAVIGACGRVKQCFNNENVDRVILLAVDSLVEAHRLEWLELTGRLKKSDNPIGLLPGEAGAAILFEREELVDRNQGKHLAEILSFATTIEENHQFTEALTPNIGTALVESIRQTLLLAQVNGVFEGAVYSDLNGEEWRARELSMAKNNLINRSLAVDIGEIIPAISFGDVGAVSPAISFCMFIEGVRRGYTVASSALILGSSAGGNTGCMLVQSRSS